MYSLEISLRALICLLIKTHDAHAGKDPGAGGWQNFVVGK